MAIMAEWIKFTICRAHVPATSLFSHIIEWLGKLELFTISKDEGKHHKKVNLCGAIAPDNHS